MYTYRNNDFEKSKRIITIIIIIVVVMVMFFNTKRDFLDNKSDNYEEKQDTIGEVDYEVLTINVELGEFLPEEFSSYVKNYDSSKKEEDFIIDTSNVVLEKVGDYKYSVRYGNTIKDGIISIRDTVPPDFHVKNVIIAKGINYQATDFVESCSDFSGCTYYFLNAEDQNYTVPGTYVVYVVAADAYQNSVTQKVSLIITAS